MYNLNSDGHRSYKVDYHIGPPPARRVTERVRKITEKTRKITEGVRVTKNHRLDYVAENSVIPCAHYLWWGEKASCCL